MILFEWKEEDRIDYENWMLNVREQIKDNVFSKCIQWSYNFRSDEMQKSSKYEWEEIVTVCPRLSSIRTTWSTMPTLNEDETLEEIPSISESDIRFSHNPPRE